jgi:hypothetical protein
MSGFFIISLPDKNNGRQRFQNDHILLNFKK